MMGHWIANVAWTCWFKKPKKKKNICFTGENEGTWTERKHLVARRRNPPKQVKAEWKSWEWLTGFLWNVWQVLWEPESPWFPSPSAPHSLSTPLLSAHLLLSLCIVSGHSIAMYTPDHLSRKEGFSIWMQEYLVELRIWKYSQLLQETEPKAVKVIQSRKVPSISFRQECLLSLLLVFFSPPLSLSFLHPPPLPRWVLFLHSCNQTSALPLHHFLVQASNGDLWVIE